MTGAFSLKVSFVFWKAEMLKLNISILILFTKVKLFVIFKIERKVEKYVFRINR